MAANSFLLKGWCVTLIAALAALAAKDAQFDFVWIAILPALAFWTLDAFFLRQEKLFRELYNDVRKKSEDDIDYSLKTESYETVVDNQLKVAFSPTVSLFYGPIVAAIFIVWAFTTLNGRSTQRSTVTVTGQTPTHKPAPRVTPIKTNPVR